MKNSALLLSSLAGVICSGLISGCSPKTPEARNYELSQPTKDGGVFRLDQRTGEVRFLLAQGSVIVPGTESVEAKTNRVVNWGQSKSGIFTGELKTSWRDGKLYYLFTLSPSDAIPVMSKEKLSSAGFVIYFFDPDVFVLKTISINLEEMFTRTNRAAINPFAINNPLIPTEIISLGANGNVNCDFKTYQSFGGWNYTRNGF